MRGKIATIAALAGCMALFGAVAQAKKDKAAPANSPAASPDQGGSSAKEDRQNIESLKALDARGSYIHLVGQSLFLTPGRVIGKVKGKTEAPGAWFDIGADPASPALVNASLPEAWDVVVLGDYALTCVYTPLLTVYDIRDRQWRHAAQLDMPANAENIVVRGNLAYVANHTAGLTIVDISKPSKPVIFSNLNPKIDCDAVALWHDSAVLYAHHQGQVVVADISDPAKPRQTGLCQLPAILNGGELEVDGGFAYVTSRKGLFIVNVADPAAPKLVKTVELGAVANDVILKDGYAFVAADERGVRVLDTNDPVNPVEVGHYQDGEGGVALALAVERAAPAGGATSQHEGNSGKTAAGATPASESAAPGSKANYYLYVANMAGPAKVLLFHAPSSRKTR